MTETTLTPALTAQKMFETALAKNRQRLDLVFFKAFIAGVFLSFGGLLHVIISGGSAGLTSTNPGLVKILGGLVFPVGLVMIVLQGQELLTSNMMTVPMLMIKRAAPWYSIPLNWTTVLFGNLTGSLFFAGVLTKASGILAAEPYPTYIRNFVIHKAMDPHWHQIFLRGIGCNWLVCIAVWQAMAASEVVSKIIAIFIPIFVFVAAGFDHGHLYRFFIPLGIMMGAKMTVADYIKKSLIASFLGNVVGALLVALPFMFFYNPSFQNGPRDVEEDGGSSATSIQVVPSTLKQQ
ncbi:formate/nitrite transporter family protein [Ceratobasidium sp. AG-Ba]|nr:formate/nitrite transporter family protein [Ceratobasidium sp. AG-Ba]